MCRSEILTTLQILLKADIDTTRKDIIRKILPFFWSTTGNHWGDKLKVGSPEIPWQLDDDNTFQLPKMQSDIVLSLGDDYLIIDAKYYGMNLYQNMGKTGIHSANLYQIFTYVKNKETEVSKKENPHSVSGLLLYAMTQGKVQPDADYSMSGNRISAKTLNLHAEWNDILNSLDSVIYQYFNIIKY